MGIKGSISVAHSLTAHSASIPKCNDGVLPCALVHTSTHDVVVCGVLYAVQVLPCSESNVFAYARAGMSGARTSTRTRTRQ